jgi:hypothetical protein
MSAPSAQLSLSLSTSCAGASPVVARKREPEDLAERRDFGRREIDRHAAGFAAHSAALRVPVVGYVHVIEDVSAPFTRHPR